MGRLRNLEVKHVIGNPLDYDELTAKIDVTRSASLPPHLLVTGEVLKVDAAYMRSSHLIRL